MPDTGNVVAFGVGYLTDQANARIIRALTEDRELMQHKLQCVQAIIRDMEMQVAYYRAEQKKHQAGACAVDLVERVREASYALQLNDLIGDVERRIAQLKEAIS